MPSSVLDNHGLELPEAARHFLLFPGRGVWPYTPVNAAAMGCLIGHLGTGAPTNDAWYHVSPAFGGIHHRSSEILHQPAQGWTGAPTNDAWYHVSPAFGGIHHHSSEILHQPAKG